VPRNRAVAASDVNDAAQRDQDTPAGGGRPGQYSSRYRQRPARAGPGRTGTPRSWTG